MKCQCKTNIEHELLGKIQEQHPEWGNPSVELGGYAFIMEANGMCLKNTSTAEITYTHTFKNGKTKQQKMSMSVVTPYCPHCGKKQE